MTRSPDAPAGQVFQRLPPFPSPGRPMQRLNRLITSDGVEYLPGTPVSDLPLRIRGSVVESGWATAAEDLIDPPRKSAHKPASSSAPADTSPADPPADKPAPKPRPSRAKPKS